RARLRVSGLSSRQIGGVDVALYCHPGGRPRLSRARPPGSGGVQCTPPRRGNPHGAVEAQQRDLGSELDVPDSRMSGPHAMDFGADSAAGLSLPMPGTRAAPAGGRRRVSGEGERRVLVVAPEPFYEDRGTPIAVRNVL